MVGEFYTCPPLDLLLFFAYEYTYDDFHSLLITPSRSHTSCGVSPDESPLRRRTPTTSNSPSVHPDHTPKALTRKTKRVRARKARKQRERAMQRAARKEAQAKGMVPPTEDAEAEAAADKDGSADGDGDGGTDELQRPPATMLSVQVGSGTFMMNFSM